MSKIKSIHIQNNFNNGISYKVGTKYNRYTISEIVDNSKSYYDSKEYEFHILAKNESNDVFLLAKIINCKALVEYEIN